MSRPQCLLCGERPATVSDAFGRTGCRPCMAHEAGDGGDESDLYGYGVWLSGGPTEPTGS